MTDYYIIRDTLNRPDLANILTTLVKEHHPNLNVLSVSSLDQLESIKYLNDKIINLDPFTRVDNHFKIDICRVFKNDDQIKPIGYTNRNGFPSLEEQILNIPEGEYCIVDDDICSGGTIKYIKEKIYELNPSVRITKELSLIHEIFPELRSGVVKLFDTIDTHDFFDLSSISGLLINDGVNTKRHLYIDEIVNLKTRAKIVNDSQFREQFFEKIRHIKV